MVSILFFLISKERGQTSRGIIDIPTRLAPRETSIVCRQTQNILLKKGEKDLQKEGGLDQNPQNEQKRKGIEETRKTFQKNRSKTSVIRKLTSIPKEIKPQFTW